MADRPESDWELDLKPASLQQSASPSATQGRRLAPTDDSAISLAVVEGLRSLGRSLERIEERLTTIENALAIVSPAAAARTRIPPVRRQRTADAIRSSATLTANGDAPTTDADVASAAEG